MARYAVAAAALLILPLPAAASVVVIGGSAARECFEAADSRVRPTQASVERCDHALDEGLNRRDTVATHVNRGIVRMRTGDLPGAREDFDRALALDPTQPEAYLNRGIAMLRVEDAQTALAMFDRAIQRNTRRPALAHYGRAIAHEALGNLRAAYRDYRRASELDPRWDEPRADLARFSVRR